MESDTQGRSDRYQADDDKRIPRGLWKSIASYKSFYSQGKSLCTAVEYRNWEVSEE